MSIGYSFKLVELNRKADSNLIGVRLGRVCIEQGISVSSISEKLGVSRQTIYNWFSGITFPKHEHIPCITTIIAQLTSSK
jgi:transcriptional regulator with XRE-family HTH domain